MLTQTLAYGSSKAGVQLKAEIMVEGFRPQEKAQDRFDIGASYRKVAMLLKERGFTVKGCEDHHGQEFHGGELSGIPWNECLFDVYTNLDDASQRKLSVALNIVTDVTSYRGRLKAEMMGQAIEMDRESMTPERCLEYLKMVERADVVEVRYTLRGEIQKFEI